MSACDYKQKRHSKTGNLLLCKVPPKASQAMRKENGVAPSPAEAKPPTYNVAVLKQIPTTCSVECDNDKRVAACLKAVNEVMMKARRGDESKA